MPLHVFEEEEVKPTTKALLDDFWARIIAPYAGDTRGILSEFKKRLDSKIDEGEKKHGDASFDLPTGRLFNEIELECLDIIGWGMILRGHLVAGSIHDRHLVDVGRWACFVWLMTRELRKEMAAPISGPTPN
jgi:hypothetical protein